jgi:hypothetical protein
VSFDEWMTLWSGRVAVGATAIAAVAGMLLWFFGNRATAAKDEAFAKFKAGAEAHIADANARSAEAAKGTATALAKAAEVNERAGKLELEAAQQRERAAKAERQLEELRARTEPRRLSASQRETIVSELRQFSGTSLSIVRLGDAEAGTFADDLIAVLKAADWSLSISLVGLMGMPQYGVVLDFKGNRPSPAMAALMAAFGKVGIPVPGRGPAAEDTLLIGLKPVRK